MAVRKRGVLLCASHTQKLHRSCLAFGLLLYLCGGQLPRYTH